MVIIKSILSFSETSWSDAQIMKLKYFHNPSEDIHNSIRVNLDDLSKPTYEQFFTIITTAVDSNNVQQTNLVFDFCTPCPEMCPSM